MLAFPWAVVCATVVAESYMMPGAIGGGNDNAENGADDNG